MPVPYPARNRNILTAILAGVMFVTPFIGCSKTNETLELRAQNTALEKRNTSLETEYQALEKKYLDETLNIKLESDVLRRANTDNELKYHELRTSNDELKAYLEKSFEIPENLKPEDYNIENFYKILRWNGKDITPDKEKRKGFEDFWNSLEQKEKSIIYNAYRNPLIKYDKKTEWDKEVLPRVNSLMTNPSKRKTAETYFQKFFWMNPYALSDGDKLLLAVKDFTDNFELKGFIFSP